MSASDRSDRIRDLFDEVVGLGPEERAAYLAEACGDDQELRREVKSLLEAADARGSGVRRALEGLQPLDEGAEPEPSPPGEIPAALQAALADRYRFVREIGRGGMATVYLADDRKHPRQVAIKVLNPNLSRVLGAERFLREIETASSLTHPHILPLHDSGGAEGLLYYVMPYVEGESLRDRLSREQRLPVEDAVRIAQEIANALAYAHERGVIHRDVKPANILLEAGHAVLADFGIARAVAEVDRTHLTQGGASLGTPTYMSPEQMSGEQQLDGRSDQYALGCVLYEMLAGQPPHQGPSLAAIGAKMMAGPAPSVRELRSDMPEAVEKALAVALERKPDDRHATVAEFRAALAGTASPTPMRRWTTWAATAATVAVIALGWYIGASRPGAPGVDGREGLNPNLVAVLPVTVQGSAELEYLEAGMADLLTIALDEAGELETVDSWAVLSFVERETQGPLDPQSGRDVAAHFGAGRFVLSRLAEAGGRIRASSSLYRGGREPETRADADVADETQIYELVDEVARQLVVGRAETAGDQLTRIGALTTNSLTAMKAYLRGEALFRSGFLNPAGANAAIAEYRQAVAADTTFALAYFRMAYLQSVAMAAIDVGDAAERARRHRDRLPQRERGLLQCFSALFNQRDEREAAGSCQRVLDQDPNDADALFLLGDALHHYGLRRGRPTAAVREAYDQAMELEPSYMYGALLLHRAWIARIEEDFASWARYRELFVQMHPQNPSSRLFRLAVDAWHGDESALEEFITAQVSDPARAELWVDEIGPLDDRLATTRVLRGLTSPVQPQGRRALGHALIAHEELAAGRLSAARTELAQARSLDPDGSLISRAYLLLSPYLPVTTHELSVVRDEVAGWSPVAPGRRVWRLYVLGLLDERVGNRTRAEQWASEMNDYAVTRTAENGGGSAAALAEDLARYLQARLAARDGQYEEAWELLQQTAPQRWWDVMPRKAYQKQVHERWLAAEVLIALDRREEALHWLAGFGMEGEHSYMGIRHFRMAEIYEELGNREKATYHYGRFVTYWKDADPEVQWRVEEARQRIEALSAEG